LGKEKIILKSSRLENANSKNAATEVD